MTAITPSATLDLAKLAGWHGDPNRLIADGIALPDLVAASAEVKVWDDLLNADYQRLLGRLGAKAEESVRQAQRAWVALRDADCRVPYEIYEGGFFPPPTYKFNEDIRGVVDYLWRRWFDSPQAEQSKAIKAAPKIRRPRPSTRQRQLQRRAEQLRLIRRAKKLLDLK